MNRAKLLQGLQATVGEQGVVTLASDLEVYEKDWRDLFRGRAMYAVLPRNTQQVAAIVRQCSDAGVAIVPHGGNTGLAGGATPDASGRQIVLSLSRMNAIRGIDVAGETIEVEAGCILQVAQEAAAEKGLLLPVSLAAEGSAQIGGVVSTNAGGTNVVRFGMARNRVLGLEVVTSDGAIVSGLRHLRKDNAGYDWKQWFIGTEGTLGIVTAAVLQLAPMPKFRVTALLAVLSAEDALQLLVTARQAMGEVVTGFELMSEASLELVERHCGVKLPLGPSPWYVLLEASSSLPALREAVEDYLAEALEQGSASDGVLAESERQEAELWSLRESITEAESKEGRSVKHDVSVPISSIPEFLRVAEEAIMPAHPGARINAFGHVGDGNVHYNVIVPPNTDADGLNRLVHDLVVSRGGSISAEHGIGQYRVNELTRCRANAELELSRRIKRSLDPYNVLNPGKVLPLD